MSDKCDPTLPHQRVQTCLPSVVTEDKCAVIDCEYKTVKVTTTTTADCVKTVVIMDGATVLPAITQLVNCKEPIPVISVCTEKTSDVTGVDCTGAPITAKGVQTIPHPTAVQLVKMCTPAGTLDRSYSTLCAPDGTKVLVVTAWDTTAPLATAPVVETYTLASSVYTGDRALLTDCAAEKLDIVAEEYCSSGLQYERISFYDVSTLPPTLTATLWRDSSGASVAAPAAGAVGACKTQISIDRPICANTNTGEIWNMVERTSTDAAGSVTTSYWDPDTSPMTNVTALFFSMRHGGTCECCLDTILPTIAELSLVKTTSTPQAFPGDNVEFVLTATNNGPDAADGATITDQIPTGMMVTNVAVVTAGGATGVSGSLPTLTVGTFPAGGTVQITVTGVALGGNIFNTATVSLAGNAVDNPTSNNTGSATVQGCMWETYHELLVPVSTIMGVYTTGSGVNNLGFVDPDTGVVTNVANIPGTNLNALGLDKSSNNAVFLDRTTGNIYTAYSPYYVVANPSVLQAGSIAAANAILGALDSSQQWWVGGITNSTGLVATINVAKVDPQTGVQTAIPSLTATLNSGSNGFDFDFAPNDDLYALVGLNMYVSTYATNYAGWVLVGTLTGIPGTGGSVAYDEGILRGTASTGQIWAYDIATSTTTVTSNMPAGFTMSDMSGAVDPICKRFFLNTCNNKFYEFNRVVEYVPFGTPIQGSC